MALLSLKCQNCGSALEVDSNATSYRCPYCQAVYAMEQTVYHTNQTTNIAHATIIDDGSGKINQQLSSAEAKLRMGHYVDAQASFWDLTNSCAQEYRAWWGLARSITMNFSKAPEGKQEYDVVCNAVRCAKMMAEHDLEVVSQITGASHAYLTKWEAHFVNLATQRNQAIDTHANKCNSILGPKQKEIDDLRAAITKKENKLERMENFGRIVPLVAYIGLSVLLAIITIVTDSMGIISAIFACALACGFAIFLPLKLVFFLIVKALVVPTELLISSNNKKIYKIEASMESEKTQLDEQLYAVINQTAWLDR